MKETRPGQFKVLMKKLMDTAPEGYTPWIFPVQKGNKAPSTNISWKAQQSRLTVPEAVNRLKENNGNVGLAGKPDDQLILLDVDDPSILDEVKDTLQIRSRSRGTEEDPAIHAIYWADPEDDKLPCNIPTDKGELRSSDQYVVAPGSYVPCTEEELTEKIEEGEITKEDKQEIVNDQHRGYYTVYNDQEIQQIGFDELPEVFREAHTTEEEREQNRERESFDPSQKEGNNKHSALFDLEITDLTGRGYTERDPHPLHPSSTGKNWSIGKGVGQCWRHLVSLNALQFLCVDAGFMDCREAGSPHHNSSAGQSQVTGNDEAIWVAWKHAKDNGYIPEDDPIPTRAMKHIAKKEGIYEAKKDELLPPKKFNQVIEYVNGEYQ